MAALATGLSAGLAAWVAAGSVGAAPPSSSGWADGVETLALIEQLNGALLEGRSATLTLERWCADHHLVPAPRLVAIRDRAAVRAATPEQRARLMVGPDEVIGYRHVRLNCGDKVLSEADNWYVPSRLTPEMNQALETTDTPFGRAILDLKVTRRTLSVERLWSPLPPDWFDRATALGPAPLPADRALFRHRALLVTPAGLPVSEVEETYTDAALAFPRHTRP